MTPPRSPSSARGSIPRYSFPRRFWFLSTTNRPAASMVGVARLTVRSLTLASRAMVFTLGQHRASVFIRVMSANATNLLVGFRRDAATARPTRSARRQLSVEVVHVTSPAVATSFRRDAVPRRSRGPGARPFAFFVPPEQIGHGRRTMAVWRPVVWNVGSSSGWVHADAPRRWNTRSGVPSAEISTAVRVVVIGPPSAPDGPGQIATPAWSCTRCARARPTNPLGLGQGAVRVDLVEESRQKRGAALRRQLPGVVLRMERVGPDASGRCAMRGHATHLPFRPARKQ